jgi:hypothetical protein
MLHHCGLMPNRVSMAALVDAWRTSKCLKASSCSSSNSTKLVQVHRAVSRVSRRSMRCRWLSPDDSRDGVGAVAGVAGAGTLGERSCNDRHGRRMMGLCREPSITDPRGGSVALRLKKTESADKTTIQRCVYQVRSDESRRSSTGRTRTPPQKRRAKSGGAANIRIGTFARLVAQGAGETTSRRRHALAVGEGVQDGKRTRRTGTLTKAGEP